MKFIIWYSTESLANYIINNTFLSNKDCEKKRLPESDASKPKEFHKVPDHLKKILYLDAPDLIVEYNKEPIFSLEESKEAGTGHNAFQRFSRLVAAAENNIPSFYIYPEAVVISRRTTPPRWDGINANIFKALNRLMDIYQTPALLFYYPSYFRDGISKDQISSLPNKGLKMHSSHNYTSCPAIDSEMQTLFNCINELIDLVINSNAKEGIKSCLQKKSFAARREFHTAEYTRKNPNDNLLSPCTSTIKIPTELILKYIRNQTNISVTNSILSSRLETIIYKVDATFRGDPYPGALAAIDYIMCREGVTFEDRKFNLVMSWGNLNISDDNILILGGEGKSINNFFDEVKKCERNNLLTKKYNELEKSDIPRYYMQARYGSTFSKNKHIRVYSYFCDAILFYDGVLWRDG